MTSPHPRAIQESIWSCLIKTKDTPSYNLEMTNTHWKTGAKVEVPILWSPDVKSQLTGKEPDAGKDWRWEKRMTEDEMVGWYHWLDGHEFEQCLGVGDGQGSLACCIHGVTESETTEQLHNNRFCFGFKNIVSVIFCYFLLKCSSLNNLVITLRKVKS